MRSIPIPALVILDFDGTLTKSDTISILFKHALRYQSSPSRHKPQDFTSAYKNILSAYSNSYTAHLSHQPPKSKRVSVSQEVGFLRSLKGVERASFERVGSHAIFKGIGRREWSGFGRDAVESGDVLVRKGVKEFLGFLEERGDGIRGARCCVLSVNFSKEFVGGVLETLVPKRDPTPQVKKDVDGGDRMEILANSVDPQTGNICGPEENGEVIATSEDKVRVMRDVVRRWREELSDDQEGKISELGGFEGRHFYVGDSTTDLECLLDADVGLVVADTEEGSGLIETLRRISIRVEHVSTFANKLPPEYKEEQKIVWWARDFGEILDSGIVA